MSNDPLVRRAGPPAGQALGVLTDHWLVSIRVSGVNRLAVLTTLLREVNVVFCGDSPTFPFDWGAGIRFNIGASVWIHDQLLRMWQ